MFDTRSERVATWAGNLFFLAAIAFFVTLILLATGTAGAQEYPIADSLEPDALEGDALDEDALDEDALGIERVDLADILPQVDFTTDLPLAVVPPKPREAIPTWFCWRCWVWHRGGSGVPKRCPNRHHYHHDTPLPATPPVVQERVAEPPENLEKK
jgi:hypothetical protein